MDLADIKKFILSPSDRLIFMENGEPTMVVMTFGEYEKLAAPALQGNGRTTVAEESFDVQTRPEEWAVTKGPETELVTDETSPAVQPPRLDQIRLEDLPL